jgi:hypothetical protein
MQQLGLSSNAGFNTGNTAPKLGFWKRQFRGVPTRKQKAFDWIFGVIMPVICFVFDPIFFKSVFFGVAILGVFKPFAYILSFVTVMAMSTWLIWGARLKWLNAPLAGLFLISGVVSFVIGVVLLPFSLIGLIILIGVLGFTPFLSAIIFLRNAYRAYQTAKPFVQKRLIFHLFTLSAALSLQIPVSINLQIKKSLDAVVSAVKNEDARAVRENGRKLRFVAFLANIDVLAGLYYRHSDMTNRKTETMNALAETYREITDVDIETKKRSFVD